MPGGNVSVQSPQLSDLIIVRTEEARASSPEPGLTRKILAYNDKLFLVEHRMEKGWVGTVHSHPHEQVVYVIRGHLKVKCGQSTFDARTGDSFLVRGGVEHGASAVEESLVVDIFTPSREDYIE